MHIFPVEQYLTLQSFLIRLRRQATYEDAIKHMNIKPEYVIFGFSNSNEVNEFEDLLDSTRNQFSGEYFYDIQKGVLWLSSYEDAILLRLNQCP